jgi:uncharacterized protein DUF4129
MADGKRPRGRVVSNASGAVATSGSDEPVVEPPAATTSRIARRRLAALLDLVPLALAVVAEAAWISIVGGLIAEYTLQEPSMGIGALTAFVTAGVVAARVLVGPTGDRWPSVALFLVAVGGLLGWLSSPAAVEALRTQGVFPALGVNPAGWVAALAVLRGFAHAKLPVSAATLATVFGVGVPALALAALAGGMIADPYRGRFLAEATVAVFIFAGASILALAIARLTDVGAGSGFDWRRNPAWVALLVVLVLTTLAVAVPASIASPLIALAAGALVGPLLVLGLILGFNRKTFKTLLIVTAGAIFVIGIIRLFFSGSNAFQLLPSGVISNQPATPSDPGAAGQLGLLMLAFVAMILVLVLARLWSRRSSEDEDDLDEVRLIDRGEEREGVGPPRWRLGRRLGTGPEPDGAVEAYVRLLADLESRPTVRREAAETPTAHAARLRRDGRADLSLELLAADYALARFGGVRLTPAEDRRAVGRWRRLRRSLGSTPPSRSSRAPGR